MHVKEEPKAESDEFSAVSSKNDESSFHDMSSETLHASWALLRLGVQYVGFRWKVLCELSLR